MTGCFQNVSQGRIAGSEQSQNSDSQEKGFPPNIYTPHTHTHTRTHTHTHTHTHTLHNECRLRARVFERMPLWSRLSTWSVGASSNRMAHFPIFHRGRKTEIGYQGCGQFKIGTSSATLPVEKKIINLSVVDVHWQSRLIKRLLGLENWQVSCALICGES